MREPQRKDEIILLDPVTEKSGNYFTRVRRIRAEDLRQGIWEVLDERGKILYVKAGNTPNQWLEIEVDF